MATEIARKEIKVTDLGPVTVITKESFTDNDASVKSYEVRQGGRTVAVKDKFADAEALAKAL